MAVETHFGVREVFVPQQKKFSGNAFPAVFEPANIHNTAFKDFKLWIAQNRQSVEELLVSRGALLFRNFPVNSPSEFNDVVEAFGWEEFPYVGGAAPRTNIVGRVFTSNESPPDQLIPFHHEMAQVGFQG